MKLPYRYYILSVVISLFCGLEIKAQNTPVEFRRLQAQNGLSNSQVNCILRDSQGFMWFGTQSGLDRFDGYRFKNFFSKGDDPKTLLNDCVDELYEDQYGLIWIHTSLGYCVFDSNKEEFDRTPQVWMQSVGMSGTPECIFVDSKKNLWITVNGKGCYMMASKEDKPYLFATGKGKNNIPEGEVACIAETKGTVVLLFRDGTMARLDGATKKVLWVNRSLKEQGKVLGHTNCLKIDSDSNYWLALNGATYIYSSQLAKWFYSVPEWLRAIGVECHNNRMLLRDLVEKKPGQLWIGTDHDGLFLLDLKQKKLTQFKHNKEDETSLPDNTLENLYTDPNGALWIGTYKNGVAYQWDYLAIFNMWKVGDICTIIEDKLGNYWLGTNDSGVLCYQPTTGASRRYLKQENGLESDVVVSSLCASDGSLWFGGYNGGLTRYHNGKWQSYHVAENGLGSVHVWSLAEDAHGNIIIGTLGSGVQILNPKTNDFTTYNHENSGLQSDYVSSVFVNRKGQIVIGHSQYISVLNPETKEISNYSKTKSGKSFLNPSVHQLMEDSRGLLWIATASGMNIYDVHTDKLYTLNADNGLNGTLAGAVMEDRHGNVWVSSDNGVVKVAISKHDDQWDVTLTNYTHLDGLQERPLNLRSIYLAHNGDILIGGQDGVNIHPYGRKEPEQATAEVIFSGLVLFDHPLSVGEEYGGHVVMEESLNRSRLVYLAHSDNSFTVQLAASTIVLPARKRFYYRLKGLTDKWQITPPDRSEVTFTNLSPGTYTLQVRIVGRDGRISNEVGELVIVVKSPVYLSIWAMLLYILVAALVFYQIRRQIVRRQQEKFKLQQIKREAEQQRKLDDMKMEFFTNASHELRTPLTLVISPLAQMMNQETDEKKRSQLTMIHRNANKLLNLVNQLLDFRKLDANQDSLNLATGDIINYLRTICNSFKLMQEKHLHFTFHSPVEALMMSFDDDKIGKVMNNLLSNAFKFTDNGGRVDVSVSVQLKNETQKEDLLSVTVSDTGVGISDEDKQHVFDRFYQVQGLDSQPYGGSGVGLSIVKDYVEMHDGTVEVNDNPGGGTAFTFHLPIRHDVSLRRLMNETPELESSYIAQDATMYDGSAEGRHQESVGQGEYELLIVDDSDDFLEFMKSVLGDKYRIRTAHNGKEALTMVEEEKPDVILSDVMMPEMDGIELCRTIKGSPETENIPFVLLTARVAREQKIEGMESGADDYITKPFNLELLHLRIENLIKWHKGGASGKLEPYVKEIEITSLDEKLVKDATTYVEENLSDSELSVETLSAALNMSRVHLYKKLLSITGNTPSEFIRLIRLRRAEQLLRKSQMTVSEVSYEVGFNNPRSFSKYFSEMYGITPSQYKLAKKDH